MADITMYGVSNFLAQTLDNSQEFKDFVTATIGDEIIFVVFPNAQALEGYELPDNSIGIVTYRHIDATAISFEFWTAFYVTIKLFDIEINATKWVDPTFEKLELICLKAKKLIKARLKLTGIAGDTNIQIDTFTMDNPVPDGENGLQMQVDIRMSKKLLGC